MNKLGMLLSALHDAETDLAHECRKVAERQAADHGTYYPCHTIATQCDDHARRVRQIADELGKNISPPLPAPDMVTSALDTVRHKTSELLGRHPQSGLLLLRDLHHLFVTAQAVNAYWIYLGQAAQALPDPPLLTQVDKLHRETLTHIKWFKTRMKEASPQVLAVRD